MHKQSLTNDIKLTISLINPIPCNLYRSSLIDEFIAAEVTSQYACELSKRFTRPPK